MISIEKLESILEDDIIFLTYGGSFSQSLIAGMTNILEKEVEEDDLSMKSANNIFVVFIELAQNIMNYSKKLEYSTNFDPKGLIFVGKRENKYFICSQNIILESDRMRIEPRLNTIQSSTAEEIKKLYREVRRSGRDTHDKGSGLGFLEVAKKSESINFEFKALSKERLYFKFCATIG